MSESEPGARRRTSDASEGAQRPAQGSLPGAGSAAKEEFRLVQDGHALLPSIPEPPRASAAYLRGLLAAAAEAGASDLTIQSDAVPRAELHGRLFRLGRRAWTPTEAALALAELYRGPHGLAELSGRKVLDFSYELRSGGGERRRFRVNATGIESASGPGVEISIRILPRAAPDPEFARLSDAEIERMAPASGLVVIAGATGSGKSTTMAAMIRHHLECSRRPVKIVDIQAPIEFTFGDVASRNLDAPSLIGQSEVGRHLPDFQSGIRSALRRKPHIIALGESRDLETIRSTLEAALTGHLIYTTAHAGSVSECVRRLLSVFPAEEREHRALDLGASLRFVLVQRLLPAKSGVGRVPVRECMSFPDELRASMLRLPARRWPALIEDALAGKSAPGAEGAFRKTFRESAECLAEQGLLDLREAARLIGATGGGLPEAG